jgi:hypothetical protein
MARRPEAEQARKKTAASTIAKYAYFNALTAAYPELAGFFQDLKQVVNSSATGQITQDEFNALTRDYAWFTNFDSKQQAAAIAQAQDKQNNTNLYQESVEAAKRQIAADSRQYGLALSDEDLTFLAEQSRFNGWDALQTKEALGSQIQRAAAGGQNLAGVAGSYQSELRNWAEANGLDASDELLSRYIAKMSMGEQTLDDVKADLRRTYLAGAYPAWADKINAGDDPSEIFSPYVQKLRRTLEDDNIGLNDPLMQRITQKVGADGKPVAVPLYEAEQMARQDPRWQTTDNAYATYANVAQNLLRTFGFA